jgi:hypothetical protein
MSYTDTTFLGLKKADKGTNQAFETDVFNANWNAVDAGVSALDGRLDVVEANDWVTSARIAANAVGVSELAADAVVTAKIADLNVTAGKLAATLDLSGKTVSVATPSSSAHATTKAYVDARTVDVAAWASYTPTLSSGANATATGFYTQVGKTVFVRVVLGFSGQPSAAVTVSMPVLGKSGVTSFMFSGDAKGVYPLFGTLSTGGGPSVTTVALKAMVTNGAYGSMAAVNAGVPSTWTADDSLSFTAVYEAA